MSQKILILALFLCLSLGSLTHANEKQQARWQRAQAMFHSLAIPPDLALALEFQTQSHQHASDNLAIEKYLEIFRDLKRLESHDLILQWILRKPEAPPELQSVARKSLLKTDQYRRRLFIGEEAHKNIDSMLLQWDKVQIPSLQKIYPDFFNAGLSALESRLLATLGPLIIKKENLNLRYIENRFWGFRPLELISHMVIHHTQTADITEIYAKHISQDRFEGDLAPFIAYHFLIAPNGKIFWLNALNEKVWQARGANVSSIGIALLGNLDESQASAEQFDSLGKLVGFLAKEFGINPKTGIAGHGELLADGNDTQCPGRLGREIIHQIKHKLLTHP